ncbi:enoyl-CoA hydratase/isomerase family protein [Ancylobacter terrae]|uniref:enoyl-CoA hydratase/isomerase family protein n=1 Tax=Ancylobacter sp. sgz301288 TaxID=3342077 RepID=UPI00385B801C
MSVETDIIVERQGVAGLITLDRPRALNALTHHMIGELHAALAEWAEDPGIQHGVLRAAGGRAFCAGGDIKAMALLGEAGRAEEARRFWRDEYTLDHYISIYPKPFVSLVDGICFGGGFGVSGHGRFRVAGENLAFAMPEVAIGMFPDVGGTHKLPRLRGWSGTWLALTGARIGLSDAMAFGLYTHHIPAERWPDLVDALAEGHAMEALLDRFAAAPPEPALGALYPLIDRVFAGGSVEAILAALDHAARGEGVDAEFALLQAATIRKVSPTSVAIAFEQMRRGISLTLAECLVREFRVVTRILEGHDLYEGVRAMLIEKHQNPRWQPARLEDVDMGAVAAMFDTPLPDELVLDERSPEA